MITIDSWFGLYQFLILFIMSEEEMAEIVDKLIVDQIVVWCNCFYMSFDGESITIEEMEDMDEEDYDLHHIKEKKRLLKEKAFQSEMRKQRRRQLSKKGRQLQRKILITLNRIREEKREAADKARLQRWAEYDAEQRVKSALHARRYHKGHMRGRPHQDLNVLYWQQVYGGNNL